METAMAHSKVVSSAARRPPNAGKGRVKGVPNKATADVRAAIALLAESNVEKVQGWLDRVARTDPDKALDLYFKMIEYHIPKLARSELSGPGGGPIVVAADRLDQNA